MEVVGTWKKYNNETLYLPDGKEFTPDMMHSYYPVSVAEEMAVKVAGLTLLEAKTVALARAEYMIPLDMSDEDAFKLMEVKDYEKATMSTPLERIAASLEYLCMIMSQEGNNELKEN